MATVTAIIDGTGSMGKYGFFYQFFDKAKLGLVKQADICQLSTIWWFASIKEGNKVPR